jgi:uncharacterized membrane protein
MPSSTALSRIRLRHLQCFLAIVRTGTLGGAAQALSITQPAVTKTMNELEEILGTKLFTRGRKGAAITPVAINEGGQIIGYSGSSEEDVTETWLWDEGSASALELSAVHALNDVGDIAGVKDHAEGILSGGTFTPLPPIHVGDPIRIHAMTNDGVLVGDVYDIGEPTLAQPLRFENGVAQDLPGSGSARDINRHGEIVGRRTSIRIIPLPCRECWSVEGLWSSLWSQDCPSACCGP